MTGRASDLLKLLASKPLVWQSRGNRLTRIFLKMAVKCVCVCYCFFCPARKSGTSSIGGGSCGSDVVVLYSVTDFRFMITDFELEILE